MRRAPDTPCEAGDRVRFVNDESVAEGTVATLAFVHAPSGIYVVRFDNDPEADDHYIVPRDSFEVLR